MHRTRAATPRSTDAVDKERSNTIAGAVLRQVKLLPRWQVAGASMAEDPTPDIRRLLEKLENHLHHLGRPLFVHRMPPVAQFPHS